jgi:hypothetical protein
MEVVEIKDATFSTAREIPPGRVRPQAKSVGHKGMTGNGQRKKTNKVSLPGKMAADLATADRNITEANKRMLVIDMAAGTRNFVKIASRA